MSREPNLMTPCCVSTVPIYLLLFILLLLLIIYCIKHTGSKTKNMAVRHYSPDFTEHHSYIEGLPTPIRQNITIFSQALSPSRLRPSGECWRGKGISHSSVTCHFPYWCFKLPTCTLDCSYHRGSKGKDRTSFTYSLVHVLSWLLTSKYFCKICTWVHTKVLWW